MSRDRKVRLLCVGPRQRGLDTGKVARLERGARGNQRRHRRRSRNRQRLVRVLPGLAVAALDQRDDCGILLAPCAFELTPAAARTSPGMRASCQYMRSRA
jgi:hypothetical protein